MANSYYVYEWIRLDTNEPFYVGKGHGERWKSVYDRNKWFNNIINKYPVAVNILHDNLDEQTAFEYEVWYIREYRDVIGYPLVNIADGGEGRALCGELNSFYGKHHTEESKRKMSESSKGEKNGMYGKHLSEESKQKLSDAMKGRFCGENSPNFGKVLSEEHRSKISETQKGVNNSMYGKKGAKSPVSTSVMCINTKHIFFTIADAERFYKMAKGSIATYFKGYKMCKGKKYIVKHAGKLSDGTKLTWIKIVWKHDKKYKIKKIGGE